MARVELVGRVRWAELGLIITRKTVNDFVRIHAKLVEFFEQQVSSSPPMPSSVTTGCLPPFR